MTYKVKVDVCSEFQTKHSSQSEHHAEICNVKSGGFLYKTAGLQKVVCWEGRERVMLLWGSEHKYYFNIWFVLVVG